MTSAAVDPWKQPEKVTEYTVNLSDEPDFDFSRLKIFGNLSVLNVYHILELDSCIKALASAVPDISRLSLQCSERKAQSIPPDMGRFTELEELSMGYFDVPAFPREMSALSKLRVFHTYSVSTNPFPEFLTELPVLERLTLASGNIDMLPESFAGLRSLKSLSLSNGFDHVYGMPRPETGRDISIISALTGLESLQFNSCGVNSLNGLDRLKALKRLDLSDNLYCNLNPLSGLLKLTQLQLGGMKKTVEGENVIRDITPLGALVNLTKLNISRWSTWRHDFTLNLSPLSGCHALQELNCKETDVVGLSALKKLHLSKIDLDEKFAGAWQKILITAEIPLPEDSLRNLKSADPSEKRRGLEQAAVLLEVEPDLQIMPEKEILPILMQSLSDMPDKILKTLLAATYKTSSDNSILTIPVLEEMLRRGGKAMENAIVEVFLSAHRNYDAGHRSSGKSVQNHLMDVSLPSLSTPVLISLLSKLDFGMLNSNWGDRLEELFVVVLARSASPAEQEQLLKIINKHLKAYHKDSPEDAEALIQRVEPLFNQDLRQSIVRAKI